MLATVPGERAVLNKERDTGTYRLSSYFLAKVFAETPLDLVLPLFFGCITYWVVRCGHSSQPTSPLC
jgi:hypothetical protein